MDTVLLSSPSVSGYVECSQRHLKVTGKLVKKQIFRWGEFSHPKNPDYKINVDRDFYTALKRNFDNGVVPHVQFPLANKYNEHDESPDRNIGEVVDMSADEEGVNVFIDVRRLADDVGETILGASASVSLDYTDRRSNEKVGPTLIHVAATNRPFLVDLEDFETVSLSDADTNDEVVLLTDGDIQISEEENLMDKTADELIVALSEAGVDVVAGQNALAQIEGFAALSEVVGGEVTPEAISTAFVELSNSIKERDALIEEREGRIQSLTEKLNEVTLSAATAEVDQLIEEGRIRQVNRDDMIEFSQTDRERFERFLIPVEEVEAEFSEVGVTTSESTQEVDPVQRAIDEGKRLAGLAQ